MTIKSKTRRYDKEFKMFVVGLFLSGKVKSIEELRRRFSIGGKMSVQRWLRQMAGVSMVQEKELVSLESQFQQLYEEIEFQEKMIKELKGKLIEAGAF
jgi:transposase-like protein